MSYDEKIRKLTDSIQAHVLFDDEEQAREYVDWYKQPRESDIAMRVQLIAETLFNTQERLGLEPILERIGCDVETRYSALREAITECARRFIRSAELKQLAEIGAIDRRAPAPV